MKKIFLISVFIAAGLLAGAGAVHADGVPTIFYPAVITNSSFSYTATTTVDITIPVTAGTTDYKFAGTKDTTSSTIADAHDLTLITYDGANPVSSTIQGANLVATFLISALTNVGTATSTDKNLVVAAGLVCSAAPDATCNAETTITPIGITDSAGPVITAVREFDVNGDGKIDETVLTFSEAIKDSTVVAADFTIGGTAADSWMATTSTNAGTGSDPKIENDKYITILVAAGVAGTNVKAVVYTAGTLTDNSKPAGIAAVGDTFPAGLVTDSAKPVLSPVTIASNNGNAAKAKVGDIVTLSFTASEVLNTASVTSTLYLGLVGMTSSTMSTSTSDDGGTTWTASYMTNWPDTDGVVTFKIDFNDLAGNAGTEVTATTNSSGVTFDKTAPALSSVTVASNYTANTAKAKTGSTITVSFTASEALSTTNTLSVAFSSGATPTWTERRPEGVDQDISWVAAFDADGSNLIAAIYNGSVYTSADSGVNWTERVVPGTHARGWGIFASDADGSNLIASDYDRLYTSVDSGVTWTERYPPGGTAADKTWNTVASDADGSNLIVGMYPGRVYTSADGGATWSERRPTGVDEDKNWQTFASDADGSNLIVAVNGGLIYTSSDSGVTWTDSKPTGADVNANWRVASDADGSNLIAGAYGGRFYTSSDSGVSWIERATSTNPAVNANWNKLASDADGSNLIIGSSSLGGRVYISADGGVTWTEQYPPGGTATDRSWIRIESDTDGSNLVATAASYRFYTSSFDAVVATVTTSTSDGGTTWTATYTANTADVAGPINFAINFQDLAGNVSVISHTTNSSGITFDKTPPTLTSVSITSNNSNVAKTSAGNIITLSFTASETLQTTSTPTVSFFSGGRAMANAAGVSNTSGNNWVASYTVAGVDETGAVTFAINFSDLAGNAGTAVAGVSDSTSVAIVKVAPTYSPPPSSSPAPTPAPVTPVTPPAPTPVVVPSASADPNIQGTYSPTSATESTPSLQIDLNIVQSLFPSNLCVPETLIKSVSNSSVYYCGGDGLRYVFANEAVYFTWFADFVDINVLTDAELAQIPLGHKLITHRPGMRMVKIQTDPKVYAVARGGVLRWVKDEATAKLLYGDAWNTKILDVSDALFTGYTVGEPVGE